MSILIPRSPAIISLSAAFVPREYYQTGPDRYVFLDFRMRIVDRHEGEADVEEMPVGTRIVIASADVGPYLEPNDKDIEARLPQGSYICGRDALCAGVAALIEAQNGGVAGTLDHTGAATVAYTEYWVVYIYYDSMNKKWTLATWPRGGDRFRPVRRIVWFRIEV